MKKLYVVLLLLFALFGLILVIKTNAINRFDTMIGKGLYSIHDQPFFVLINWVGKLGSTAGIISVLFLAMLLFLILKKSILAPLLLFLSVLLGNIGNKLLKAIIGRERPSFVLHMEDGFTFPSGHVMVGLILYGMIAYYLVKFSRHETTRQPIIIGASLLLLLIGFSRLIEGEHFFTDVIGGVITGGLMLIGFISIDKFVHSKLERRKINQDAAM
ncbi:phosphatase PAP2 family protein [Metabacillus sp. Hm71]|uniref:phosphatase PAP2 family protein n=1 Tax=Metabacillus sp. Hm71 TaxID=3450743 RepID=UPI003F43862C